MFLAAGGRPYGRTLLSVGGRPYGRTRPST